MSTSWRAAAWLGLLAVTVGLLWLLSPALLPFFLGMAIAYVLDPAVSRLERLGLSRTLATLAVMGLFFLIVAVALAVLVPILERQLVGLAQHLVEAAQDLYGRAVPYVQQQLRQAKVPTTATPNAGDIASKVVSWTGGLVAGLWSGGLAVVNVLSLLLITPVVTFYVLRDWPKMVKQIDGWLPRDRAPVIRLQMRMIDMRLAGFVRGQTLVCLLMGVFYAVALTIVGVNYSLVIGLLVGLLTFIPVIGASMGAVVTLIVTAFQFDGWVRLAIVLGIFLVGQFLEGYVLSPKLVGERIGLHPVWMVLALLAGGTLFGFAGLLLAAPVAATIGVLTRFALQRYLDSPLYRGGGAGGTEIT